MAQSSMAQSSMAQSSMAQASTRTHMDATSCVSWHGSGHGRGRHCAPAPTLSTVHRASLWQPLARACVCHRWMAGSTREIFERAAPPIRDRAVLPYACTLCAQRDSSTQLYSCSAPPMAPRRGAERLCFCNGFTASSSACDVAMPHWGANRYDLSMCHVARSVESLSRVVSRSVSVVSCLCCCASGIVVFSMKLENVRRVGVCHTGIRFRESTPHTVARTRGRRNMLLKC